MKPSRGNDKKSYIYLFGIFYGATLVFFMGQLEIKEPLLAYLSMFAENEIFDDERCFLHENRSSAVFSFSCGFMPFIYLTSIDLALCFISPFLYFAEVWINQFLQIIGVSSLLSLTSFTSFNASTSLFLSSLLRSINDCRRIFLALIIMVILIVGPFADQLIMIDLSCLRFLQL